MYNILGDMEECHSNFILDDRFELLRFHVVDAVFSRTMDTVVTIKLSPTAVNL